MGKAIGTTKGNTMALGDKIPFFWQGSEKPKTGNGQNHPRLPAKKVTVTFRTAEGAPIIYPKKKTR